MRGDEQAATNDASSGVQVQLPPRSNFPCPSTPALGRPSAWRTKNKDRPFGTSSGGPREHAQKLKTVSCGHNHKKALRSLFRSPVFGLICVCVRVPVRAYTLRAGVPARPSGASIPDGFVAFRNQRFIAEDPGGFGAAPAARVCVTKPLNPDGYLDHPERRRAAQCRDRQRRRSQSGRAALVVVALALKRAGFSRTR